MTVRQSYDARQSSIYDARQSSIVALLVPIASSKARSKATFE